MYLAAICLVSTAVCQDAERTFGLQSVDSGRFNGPYIFEDEGNIILGDQLYGIDMEEGNSFRLRSLEGDKKFGPFEFVYGRIIKVAGDAYIIVEKKEATPAEKQAVAPAPEPAPVPVKPVVQPRPLPTPVPAERSEDVRKPVAPAGSAAKPIAPSRPDEVREPVVRDETPDRQRMPPVVNEPRAPAQVRVELSEIKNHAGVTFVTGEESEYDFAIAGTEISSAVTIKRDVLSVCFERGFLYASWGLVMGSAWDGSVGSLTGYDNFGFDVDDGDGWRLACRLAGNLVSDDMLSVRYYGTLCHSREEYGIEYGGVWQTTQTILVPGTGTNFVPVTINRNTSDRDSITGEITETQVSGGMTVRLALDRWYVYGDGQLVVVKDVSMKPSVTLKGQEYEFELTDEETFVLSAGGGVKVAELDFTAGVGLVGRPGIVLGASFEF